MWQKLQRDMARGRTSTNPYFKDEKIDLRKAYELLPQLLQEFL
jgi:hypothetical protein